MTLQVNRLSAWYGPAQALWEVDIKVGLGEVVGILGRNGAGKSTLMRSIAGLQARVSGEVLLAGDILNAVPAHGRARRGISLVREGGKLPGSLSVRENIRLGMRLGQLRARPARTFDEVIEWFPMLEPFLDRRSELLSGGQRQALALAVAFVTSPTALLLDEPSAGLAPKVAQELFAVLKRLASAGYTILVVEQHPGWLLGFADRGYLLEVGRVIAEGQMHSLLKRPASDGSAPRSN
jgi:branched-chain amino acid transport system ATP-binding protein